jgi:hypothetical protein
MTVRTLVVRLQSASTPKVDEVWSVDFHTAAYPPANTAIILWYNLNKKVFVKTGDECYKFYYENVEMKSQFPF